MTQDRLVDYLTHLAEAAEQACSYVEGMNKDAFFADKRTQQAVIMNLVIIGEAATKLLQLHSDFLDRHSEVPWKSMKGMRNRIAHGYFTINLTIVWETIRTALPDLLKKLPAILRDARGQTIGETP